jgi:hypothetical protein
VDDLTAVEAAVIDLMRDIEKLGRRCNLKLYFDGQAWQVEARIKQAV